MLDGIIIREARPSDAEALCKIYNYYVQNTAITFEEDALSVEDFANRMQKIKKFYPYFVAECDGKIAGYTYAWKFKDRSAYDWSCETTIYVSKEVSGHGTGRALYTALENALKSQGMVHMYACIASIEEEDEYLTNASIKFHKKMGFVPCAKFARCGNKFGRWYDMEWLEKQISECKPDPTRPRAYRKFE